MACCRTGMTGAELFHSLLVSHFLSFFRLKKLVLLESQLRINILLLLLQSNHAVRFFDFLLPSDLGLGDLSASSL